MDTIKLQAHAKVNLILNVLGKRGDGYHELESVMQAIDLCDSVEVGWEQPARAVSMCWMGGCDIELDPGSRKLPSGPKNLAYEAAVRMHDVFRIGRHDRVTIRIEKRIPIAAGLAGGSADAAAVIWALARLWGLAPSGTDEGLDPAIREQLFAIAAGIGSDVPFCLGVCMGHPAALATGRGEKLQWIAPLNARIETFTPKLEVPTAKVYAALKPEDYAKAFDVQGYLAAQTLEEKCAFLGNHLQAPACRLYPKIAAEIERLSALNDGLATLQSGSGPSIFTVYRA
jgi:4-diphosphocytidyl-2-C-methyl-D-erythritol kinase